MRAISDVGAAVIGSGFIGSVHIGALRRIGVNVHGLLGSSPERSAEQASRLGLPRGYRHLAELLDDDRVEVVHVTSPNHLHHPQVRQILAAGKHVICEKPLAMTSEESADLVEMAASIDRVAAVNFNIRFYPLNQHLREHIADGGLGDVRLVTGHYFQDWLLYDTDWNWRLEPDRGGALRAVGDIGSHWLDLTSFITGLRVTEVMADLTTFIPVRHQPKGPVETFSLDRAKDTVPHEITTEDTAMILLRFDSGARGSVAISQLSAGRKNSLQYEIDGSQSAAAWDSEQPDQMWFGHRGRPNEIMFRDQALMSPAGRAAAVLPAGHVEGFGDTFGALFRAIYGDVIAGAMSERPPYATFADGHEEMIIGDAIAQSAREGRWVEVERSDALAASSTARGYSMKLGFLTAPFPDTPLMEVADWAAEVGFEVLEIACWPKATGSTRRYAGTSHIDVANLSADQAREIRAEIESKGLSISGLGFYPNPLHPDPAAPGDGHRPSQAGHRGRREDGPAARQHVHGRRRREAPRRQLGGGAARLARHRRLRQRPRPQDHPRELPDAVLV